MDVAPASPARRYFFIHVMKTAGTTFRDALVANFAPEAVFPSPSYETLHDYWFIARLENLSPERRAQIELYAGHFPFMVTEDLGLGELTRLTILRDPVERVLSNVRFRRREPEFADLTLEQVYEHERLYLSHHVNHQTKIFSTTRDDAIDIFWRPLPIDRERLELAKANLGKVEFVGVQDRFDEFCALVERDLGFDLSVRHDRHVDREAWEVSPSLRERIAEDNALDIELYEHAQALADAAISRSLERHRNRDRSVAATGASSRGPNVATIAQGRLRGRRHGGALLFAGIPYAEPPLGRERRFRPPQPHGGWSGELDTRSSFGHRSVQLDLSAEGRMSEDCLSLHVQTPALDDARRPVMVWLHPGAFEHGSAWAPRTDPNVLVRRHDVVAVSVGYRLGALGWLELGGLDPAFAGSGNVGLLDQLAALRWVVDNIAAFGGDPGQVTVFGSSAGAMSIGAMLGMAHDGVRPFQRAILQSGAAESVKSLDEARDTTARLMDRLGVTSVDALLDLPADDFPKAQWALAARRSRRFARPADVLTFAPVVDGVHLDVAPLDGVRRGRARDVAVVVGANLDDHRPPLRPEGDDLDRDEAEARLAAAGLEPERWLPTTGDEPLVDAVDRALSQAFYLEPARRLAEAQAAHRPDDTYHYRFTWPSGERGGRASHGMELGFVFDLLAEPRNVFVAGRDAPASLAQAMSGAWAGFARTGSPRHEALPEWPPVAASSATLVLDVPIAVERPGGRRDQRRGERC